ncbi:MAG: NUDIX domain-containing protein [Thermodesulfobacteriota bacterium]
MYGNVVLEGTTVRCGVGVIMLSSDGLILLERRSDNGMWSLPGGAINPGESVAEAALREVMEETGLVVDITGLVGVYSRVTDGRMVVYPDNGDRRQLVDVVLVARQASGLLRMSPESTDLRFFPPDALPDDIVPPARAPIADFLAGRRGVVA